MWKAKVKHFWHLVKTNRVAVFAILATTALGIATGVQTARVHNLHDEVLALNDDNGSLRRSNIDLTTQVSEMKSDNASLTTSLDDTLGRNQVLADFGVYLGDSLDQMDDILLETDSNSKQFIEWMVANGYFSQSYEGEIDYRYAHWEAVQHQTDVDYNDLMDDLNSTFDQLDRLTSNETTGVWY